MIITYDEHGGFFDHVEPIAVATPPPTGAAYSGFATTGLRVPGVVISPWVDPGTVYHGNLDHTSILKFIAEVFGDGTGYSSAVNARAVESVSAVLNRDTPRVDIPQPPATVAGFSPGAAPTTVIPQAFAEALGRLRKLDQDVTAIRFPTLIDRF